MRRITAFLLSFSFILISALGLWGLPSALGEEMPLTELPDAVSSFMSARLEGLPGVSVLFPRISTWLGLRLQRGVYITDAMLIEELTAPDPISVRANTEVLRLFSERLQARAQSERGHVEPIYFMLTPTARAMEQTDILAYAQPIDQKQLISGIYYHSGFAGPPALSPVRAYEALERAGETYLFYRTQNAITGLGGYYLYRELAASMRIEPRGIGRFNVTHVSHDYQGELSRRVYSANVPGDLVSVYRYADADDTYRVTHRGPDGIRVYHSLFPAHVTELYEPTDIILGGTSPRTDIKGANVFDERLLIISDHTVYSYISYLALHFKDITILSTDSPAALFEPGLIDDIDLLEYDRILISLSVETYTQSQRPAEAIAALLPLLEAE